MTEKRYFLHKHLIKNDVIHDNICHKWLKGEELESDMNTLYNKYTALKEENEQLKQYKQGVSDVLLSYSQKNLSAKQLGLLTAIMYELGVLE